MKTYRFLKSLKPDTVKRSRKEKIVQIGIMESWEDLKVQTQYFPGFDSFITIVGCSKYGRIRKRTTWVPMQQEGYFGKDNLSTNGNFLPYFH